MTTALRVERKQGGTISLSEDETGTITGLASPFGTIDSYGDTIDPGAYNDGIPEFLERGFLGWGHDWTKPVGFFLEAVERRDGLYVRGQFHSDPDSQRARTVVRERLAAKRRVGLSIGFEALDFEYREVDGRKIRALKRIKLHEVSIVTVPAAQEAHVTDGKVSSAPLTSAQERRLDQLMTLALKHPDQAPQLAAMARNIKALQRQADAKAIAQREFSRFNALERRQPPLKARR